MRTGSGFPTQGYESGLVAALSMAVVQALNARNLPNPLSLIQCEVPYEVGGWTPHGGGRPRYLRADMLLDLSHLRVGSAPLAGYQSGRPVVWCDIDCAGAN